MTHLLQPAGRKGFTMLEMLMVIAIMALAIIIVSLPFGNLNSTQALEKSASLAISVLDEARSMTLSAVDDAQYGVRLESDSLILFKGASYSASDPENVVTPLNVMVGLRDISLTGGGVSIIFNRLTGNTAQTGTFELYLHSDTTTYRTISVSGTGIAEEI
jgi:prepilin-type N-terminal cleavage/methylation domain-containing protein